MIPIASPPPQSQQSWLLQHRCIMPASGLVERESRWTLKRHRSQSPGGPSKDVVAGAQVDPQNTSWPARGADQAVAAAGPPPVLHVRLQLWWKLIPGASSHPAGSTEGEKSLKHGAGGPDMAAPATRGRPRWTQWSGQGAKHLTGGVKFLPSF